MHAVHGLVLRGGIERLSLLGDDKIYLDLTGATHPSPPPPLQLENHSSVNVLNSADLHMSSLSYLQLAPSVRHRSGPRLHIPALLRLPSPAPAHVPPLPFSPLDTPYSADRHVPLRGLGVHYLTRLFLPGGLLRTHHLPPPFGWSLPFPALVAPLLFFPLLPSLLSLPPAPDPYYYVTCVAA
ncbi:unnamed protein product [Closterium sp. Naga37s-1]|nr:unnamed protein product [Closterium sp. Naga37s-1]